MLHRRITGAIVLSLLLPLASEQAHDEMRYPAFEGKLNRDASPPRYDPSKPPRREQEPPH